MDEAEAGRGRDVARAAAFRLAGLGPELGMKNSYAFLPLDSRTEWKNPAAPVGRRAAENQFNLSCQAPPQFIQLRGQFLRQMTAKGCIVGSHILDLFFPALVVHRRQRFQIVG